MYYKHAIACKLTVERA